MLWFCIYCYVGIKRLLKNEVYTAAYPLHEVRPLSTVKALFSCPISRLKAS